MNSHRFHEEVYEAISDELGSGVPTSEQIVRAADVAIRRVVEECAKVCDQAEQYAALKIQGAIRYKRQDIVDHWVCTKSALYDCAKFIRDLAEESKP